MGFFLRGRGASPHPTPKPSACTSPRGRVALVTALLTMSVRRGGMGANHNVVQEVQKQGWRDMRTPPGSQARAGSKLSRASAMAVPTRETIVRRSYRFLDTPETGEVDQENSKMPLFNAYFNSWRVKYSPFAFLGLLPPINPQILYFPPRTESGKLLIRGNASPTAREFSG